MRKINLLKFRKDKRIFNYFMSKINFKRSDTFRTKMNEYFNYEMKLIFIIHIINLL